MQAAGRSGGEGSAGPGEGGGGAEVEGWPDTEDTGRRLSDDCWTGPQGLTKKEESAVQQRRREVPPFSDVSPAACSFRRRWLPGAKWHLRAPGERKNGLPGAKWHLRAPGEGRKWGRSVFRPGTFPGEMATEHIPGAIWWGRYRPLKPTFPKK